MGRPTTPRTHTVQTHTTNPTMPNTLFLLETKSKKKMVAHEKSAETKRRCTMILQAHFWLENFRNVAVHVHRGTVALERTCYLSNRAREREAIADLSILQKNREPRHHLAEVLENETEREENSGKQYILWPAGFRKHRVKEGEGNKRG